MIKIAFGILILFLFNGCIQGSAFFGPALTVVSTGNVYQAGLSYGSNLAIKNITGKSPMENLVEILEPKENDNKIISSAKEKINKASKIKDLSSQ
mgnify:CR=1 FL=1